MSLILCPECNAQISDKSAVCIHCGCPLSISSDINIEIELIENQLFNLQTVLQQKKSHNEIYDKLANLFATVHKKIDYKPNPQYDDLLFIMVKHLCYNVNVITHSIVTQYFKLIEMKYVTENVYAKSIELILDTIKNTNRHITYWFPIYQLLENAPDENKKYLKSILQEPNAFGQPKINAIYSYAEKYLSGELHTNNKVQIETNKPKCPTCGSTNIEKISTASKAIGFVTVGVFSSNFGKTMHCKNCGYKF